MALTDSLRILITANGAQAEREFAKVGTAARRSLGSAESASQRWSRSLTSAGVAMATTGGLIVAGLVKAAQAAEQERQSTLQLENAIQNMPELAGASTDAFLELASSMQDTTKFADDVVVSAEAMLGTFHLTEQQILRLTPAVADYAARFGIDLVDAAKQVGRAVSGSAGALQRNGVMLDENAYAADHFGTVLDALKENAGGFAEQEGATLSGQMAILKNNMDDIVESVGMGAVSAFNRLLGPVKAVSSGLESMSPEASRTVGEFATFGAVGLTAGGALLVVAGQALRLKDTLVALGDTAVATRVKLTALSAVETQAATSTAASGAATATAWGGILLVATAASAAFAELYERTVNFDAAVAHIPLSIKLPWNPFEAADGGIQMLDKHMSDMVNKNAGTQALRDMRDAASEAGVEIDQLSQEIQDYLDGTFDLPEAQRNLRDSFDNLFETLLTQGHSLDDVDASLQAITESTAGVIAAGGNANAVASLTIARLRDQKNAGLITTDQFRLYRDAILNVPGVSRTEVSTPGAPESNDQVRNLDRGLKGLPPTTIAHVQAMGAATAISEIGTVKRMLGEIDGKRATSFVDIVTTGSAPIKSATGRTFPLGGVSVVGERGPELLSIPAGGRVFSNFDSKGRINDAAKKAQMGGDTTVVVPLYIDSEKIGEAQARLDRQYNNARGEGN